MSAIRLPGLVRTLLTSLAIAAAPAAAYDWLQFNGGPAHSGNNTLETSITAANVATLTVRFQATLPAVADGAPVLLERVTTPGGTKDLLFVTTKAGDAVALDANNGAQVWIRQYPAGGCRINNGSNVCYTTSSPAIDPNREFVYAYGLDGKVHKLAVGDGTEVVTDGWPQTTTLKGFDEKASSALSTATANGTTYLYVAHGGYPGDNGDYQGHVTAIDLATGTQSVFNTMCSGTTAHFARAPAAPSCPSTRSAIWARPGVVYHGATNRILVATGNGNFNAGTNWSESVLALYPDGTGAAGAPLDSYTPAGFQSLDNADADLGSTAPAILPVPPTSAIAHVAVQGGKDTRLRLINLANMSGLGGPGHTGGELGAVIGVPQGGGVLAQPAIWVNPADGTTWVFVANGNGISGLQLVVDANGMPALQPRWQKPGGGTSAVVANNVLYYAGTGALRALDPASGATLWTGGAIGAIHWQSPVVANGMVYVADQSGKLTAYGLPATVPTTTTLGSSNNPSAAGEPVVFTASVAASGGAAVPTGTVTFRDGAVDLTGCVGVAVVSGQAQCQAAALAAGSHPIVAAYGGDAATGASTSPVLLQEVGPARGVINVALASNGAVARASSVFSASFPVRSVNDNERAGIRWGSGGGWNDASPGAFPDWVEIRFAAARTIDRIVVYTLQDDYANPIEPTDSQTFTRFGVTRFDVQARVGSKWKTLATVADNRLVKRSVAIAPTTTSRIRVRVTGSADGWSRLTEIEAWGN